MAQNCQLRGTRQGDTYRIIRSAFFRVFGKEKQYVIPGKRGQASRMSQFRLKQAWRERDGEGNGGTGKPKG